MINEQVCLPGNRIIVIARADKSGTTEIFTSALSQFSSEWNSSFGTFSAGIGNDDKPIYWNDNAIGYYGRTTTGVSGFIMSLKYTIGYMSLAEAKESGLPYVSIINKAGNAIVPTRESIQNAMDESVSTFTDKMTTHIVDSAGKTSYPIAGYTYLIINMKTMASPESAIELYRYIEWFNNDPEAQNQCEAIGMAPLSLNVTNKIMEMLNGFQSHGTMVKTLVDEQKRAEQQDISTQRITIYITIAIFAIIVLTMISYIGWQKLSSHRAILKKEWNIPTGNIILSSHTKRPPSLWSVATSGTGGSLNAIINSVRWATQTIKVALWKEEIITLRYSQIDDKTEMKWKTKQTLLWFKDSVKHTNVLRFYGTTIMSDTFYFVSEFCSKGLLQDVLYSDKYKLDDNFKLSMSSDIARGMTYLHSMDIIHGHLSCASCFIDAKWTVKIADFEHLMLAISQKRHMISDIIILQDMDDENLVAKAKLCQAPEMLRGLSKYPTKASDVYTFAFLTFEIFALEQPFYEYLRDKEAEMILEEICINDIRPKMHNTFPSRLCDLLMLCWASVENDRPTFVKICKMLSKANPLGKSVLDCMMEALDEYVANLEEKVNERTAELNRTMDSFKELLYEILPTSVADKLSRGEKVDPESYESVTLYFSDIVGFTHLSSLSTPLEIVAFLNDLYTMFDAILDQHEVYKVETIGDAYMVISGLPIRNGIQHAAHIANMAIDLAKAADSFKIRHKPQDELKLRIGIHSGSVVTGVVGIKMPRYCLFGDTVNTASRMESTSLPKRLQISTPTCLLLQEIGGYTIAPRGDICIKVRNRS